ncbi:hypothetical protein P9112_004928 [Eukaryota sp. TZLM1-RC]
MRPVDRPYLTSLSEGDSVTDNTKMVLLRLSVDSSISKSLEFPKQFFLLLQPPTLSRLKMNVKITSAKERMNDDLRSFLKEKEKADCLVIFNSVFMKQFAAGITPKGLAESPLFRINDQLIPDFKTLVQVGTKGIVAHDRSKV